LDIEAWLQGLRMERYTQAFLENDIVPAVLQELTDQDLKDLGVSLGHRRLLLKAISALPVERAGASPLEIGASVSPPPSPRPEAERRQLTVLFCDLAGSTELSARFDPEDMRETIRGFQDCCAGVIARFDGYLAKYMGDGVLAYFGYPRAHEDEAERAVRAGLALAEAINKLRTPADEPLAARVGIATGVVVVGDLVGIGASQEQAAVGETPNLAARLQSLAAPDSIVISPNTRRLVGGIFALKDLGPQYLKGFTEPVGAWRVVGISTVASRFEAMHETALTPLVGREHELGLLLDRWEFAKCGEGQVVLLSGEPGIGKSRIVQALYERLKGEALLRLRYFCSPYHVNSALYPVIDQLERAAGLRPEDGAEAKLDKITALVAKATQSSAEVVPIIAALLSVPIDSRFPPVTLTPAAQKARTFEALLTQLVDLAQRQPLLMVFEDAHWIDPTTTELFGLVVDRIQRLPVLLLMTFRPEFTPPWTSYQHVTSLTLSRLGQRQGAMLVESLTGSKSLPAEVLQQILRKTDGVPLFVEELTKTVLDSGLLADAGDHFELSAPLPPLALPATLHDSLMARLDRLAPVKEVAQIGAVIGREFSYQLLAAVVSLDGDQLQDALAQLVASELIFRRGVPSDATYTFKHALVRDAAYQSLLKVKRQQFHQRIARVLEERFSQTVETEPEILAQHYSEAGLAERALHYWHKSGQLAAHRAAYVEAVIHFNRGLELLSELPETRERHEQELQIYMALGPALVAARGFADPGVGHAYARAWDLCQRLDDTVHLPLVLRGRQVFHRMRGELVKARAFGEQLLTFAERQQDPSLLVGGCQALGQDLFQMGDLMVARMTVERGIALFDPKQHRLQNWPGGQPGEQCYLYCAFVLWLLGYPDQALRRGEEALTLAKDLSNPANLVNTLAFVTLVHVLRRDLAAARQWAEATMAMSTEQRNPFFLAWGQVLHGWTQAALGLEEDGNAELDQGLAAYRGTGSQTWLPCFLCLRAETYLRATRLKEGLASVAEALALSEKTQERCWQAELNRIKGELLRALSSNDHAEADSCFSRSLDISRDQQAKSWELRTVASLSRLWRDQGKSEAARDLLLPIHGWFTEGLDTPDLTEAEALLDELDPGGKNRRSPRQCLK
jgi:class 3 adenylate cyclase/predicted ATPase